MKNLPKQRKELMSALCILFISMFCIQGQSQDTLRLSVEPNHSTILFSVPISGGITRVTGKFTDYTIDMDLIDKDFTQASLEAKIKVASINTGIPDRDEHLKTADFFDAETYPDISFKSDSIILADHAYRVFGKFKMRNTVKSLDFPLVHTGVEGKNTYGFATKLSINRTDFGVGTGFKHDSMDNFIGEEIGIEINFWTRKRKVKQ